MSSPSLLPPRYHACADIGGSKLSVFLVRTEGMASEPPQILAKQVEATVKVGEFDSVPLQLVRMVDAACAAMGVARSQIASVNVATCGLFVNGDLIAPNICSVGGWPSIPLRATLLREFAHCADNIRIENDGVAALLAERRWGTLQGCDHAAYITWSTGIGVGLMVDGRVLRGRHGNAGHAGHMMVGSAGAGAKTHGLQCACGNVDDAQALVAGSSIPKRWPKYPSAQTLLDAASAGDVPALAHVQTLCQEMVRVIGNLVCTLDLERIALGGSVFWHHRALLLPAIQAQVAQIFPAMTRGLEIVPAGLGESVGDYAALAVLDEM